MGNWLIAALLALAAVLGVVIAENADNASVEARDSYARSLAGSMQVYRNSVVEYAESNTTASGTIADSKLDLPSWYSRISDIKNYVSGGLGYVYVSVANDGQAYELLKLTGNDVHVGINNAGVLYNPLVGSTGITLPSAIPDGAVVFAPASLSTAADPPAEAAAPSGCTVKSGTTRSWTADGNSCSASVSATTTIAHLAALTFTDAAPGTTGSAKFYCNDGSLQTTAGDVPTCDPPPACTVASGTSRSWTVDGTTCAGTSSATTIASGSSLTISSSNGNEGAAGFTCSEGTLASTPNGTQTCVTPCAVPSPDTETETQTRTASQDVSECGSGYTGTVNQTRTEKRTRTRTAYCPATTGNYAWGSWSDWGSWTATTSWTTVSTNCTKLCVAPSSTTATETQWVSQSESCPTGQSGSHTWEKQQSRTATTSYTCASSTASSATASTSYSAWADTGSTRNDTNTCVEDSPCKYNQNNYFQTIYEEVEDAEGRGTGGSQFIIACMDGSCFSGQTSISTTWKAGSSYTKGASSIYSIYAGGSSVYYDYGYTADGTSSMPGYGSSFSFTVGTQVGSESDDLDSSASRSHYVSTYQICTP